MIKIITISLLCVFIASCAIFDKKINPVKVITVTKPTPIFHPPLPPKMSLVWNKDAWTVVTPEIIEKYTKDYHEGTADPIIAYMLSVEDYESLSIIMSKLMKQIADQKEIINSYRSIKSN